MGPSVPFETKIGFFKQTVFVEWRFDHKLLQYVLGLCLRFFEIKLSRFLLQIAMCSEWLLSIFSIFNFNLKSTQGCSKKN